MQKLLKVYSYFTDQHEQCAFEEFFPSVRRIRNKHVIYAGFVGGSFCNVDDIRLAEYRKKLTEHVNQDTIVIFDCGSEGVVTPMIRTIHKLIEGIVSEKNVYYITAALNAQEIYDKCNIPLDKRISIRIINYWERHVKFSFDLLKDNIIYSIKEKEKVFLCFNRVARTHRLGLLGFMVEHSLLEKAFYSYLGTQHLMECTKDDFIESINRLSHEFPQHVVPTLQKNLSSIVDKFPLKLNINQTDNITQVREEDRKYFENSYFSLVTETFFFNKDNGAEGAVFFSEKIFKPIIMKHPFILLARKGYLKELKKLGYKTFDIIIDESYDDIDDDTDRMKYIVNEIERLSKNSPEQWIEWQTVAKDIVEHNYNVFMNRKSLDYIIGEKWI